MERKLSTKTMKSNVSYMFLRIDNVLVSGKMMTEITILIVKISNHQITADIPQNVTEVVKFLDRTNFFK